MALTPEQIIKTAHEASLYQDGINTQLPLFVLTQEELERFAHAIEAEVRKQDDELIQQLVDALEGSIPIAMGKAEQRNTALIAGRARLEESA